MSKLKASKYRKLMSKLPLGNCFGHNFISSLKMVYRICLCSTVVEGFNAFDLLVPFPGRFPGPEFCWPQILKNKIMFILAKLSLNEVCCAVAVSSEAAQEMLCRFLGHCKTIM